MIMETKTNTGKNKKSVEKFEKNVSKPFEK